MKKYIADRALQIAHYLLAHKATVRSAATAFAISKSTVHKDVTERLRLIDAQLEGQVAQLLTINTQQRHIRGGNATKRKYGQGTL